MVVVIATRKKYVVGRAPDIVHVHFFVQSCTGTPVVGIAVSCRSRLVHDQDRDCVASRIPERMRTHIFTTMIWSGGGLSEL